MDAADLHLGWRKRNHLLQRLGSFDAIGYGGLFQSNLHHRLEYHQPPAATEPGGLTDGPFIGDVQSFYVWNVCLSAAEVQEQMWNNAGAPYQPSNLLLGYDFTANPPKKIGNGPSAAPTNTLARGDASALASWGGGVATPGQASDINPGGSAPFSLLAWIYVGNDALGQPNLNGYVFSNGAAEPATHMGLKLVNGTLVGEIGSTSVASAALISGYTWYYVGFTYDGTNGSLYIANAAVASGALSGSSPATGAPALFGAVDSNGTVTDGFQGYIQFLSVWNTCLTATEVQQQADEDPTLDSNCVANFMASQQPCVDSIAVKKAVLWNTDQLQFGDGIFFGPTYLSNTSGAEGIQGPKHQHRSAGQTPISIPVFKDTGDIPPSPVDLLSERHKQLLLNEFKDAAASMTDAALTERWIEEFSTELDRVFDQARTAPGSIDGPHVSYKIIDGQFGLFYHPDPDQEIDLGVRLDQECAAWWATFILTTILGVFAIFGVETPIDDLTRLATQVVNDPVVIETCTSVVGFTLTAGTMLAFCRVLYDFGYLSQAFWLVASSIGWWGAGKLLVYFVGVMLPVASPQKVLFIANTIKLVAKLAVKLTAYRGACGNGECSAA